MSNEGMTVVVIIAVIIGILAGLAVYFIPTFIAFGKHKSNRGAVFALNFFLGWALIGWVIALVWALKQDVVDYQQPVYVPQQPMYQQPPQVQPPLQYHTVPNDDNTN